MLDNVEGMEGKKLKVWIRRVWTLEMVSPRPNLSVVYVYS